MALLLDNVRFNPTAGGTTDWTYSSAVAGYQSPAAAGILNGAIYSYFAISADSTQWEIGQGAYNTSTGVLLRTTVLSNSSGTGSGTGQSGAGTKINFSAAPTVAIVGLAEDMTPFDAMRDNNLAINGAMDVSQINGTTAVTVNSSYVVDQWLVAWPAASGSFQAQQAAGGLNNGIPNCLVLHANTGAGSYGATDGAYFVQPIEGYRWAKLNYGSASGGQQVTIGFWVQASVTGTGTVSIRNTGGARSYLANFTVSAAGSWQWVAVTIPPDTTGTWNTTNGIGAYVSLCFGVGSTYTGTASAWQSANVLGTAATTNFFATAGNQVAITGVVVLPGTQAPSAAGSPFCMRSFDTELLLCQRYYSVAYGSGRFTATAISQSGETPLNYPVQMRATPTITLGTPGLVLNQTSGYPQAQSPNNQSARFIVASNAAGDCYALMTPAKCDARM